MSVACLSKLFCTQQNPVTIERAPLCRQVPGSFVQCIRLEGHETGSTTKRDTRKVNPDPSISLSFSGLRKKKKSSPRDTPAWHLEFLYNSVRFAWINERKPGARSSGKRRCKVCRNFFDARSSNCEFPKNSISRAIKVVALVFIVALLPPWERKFSHWETKTNKYFHTSRRSRNHRDDSSQTPKPERGRIGAAYKFELSIPSLLPGVHVRRERRLFRPPRPARPFRPSRGFCVRHPREKSPHAPEERRRVGRRVAERGSPTQWHMVGCSCRVGWIVAVGASERAAELEAADDRMEQQCAARGHEASVDDERDTEGERLATVGDDFGILERIRSVARHERSDRGWGSRGDLRILRHPRRSERVR